MTPPELFGNEAAVRRYYATHAMAGLLTSGCIHMQPDEKLYEDEAEQLARRAFLIADAMAKVEISPS